MTLIGFSSFWWVSNNFAVVFASSILRTVIVTIFKVFFERIQTFFNIKKLHWWLTAFQYVGKLLVIAGVLIWHRKLGFIHLSFGARFNSKHGRIHDNRADSQSFELIVDVPDIFLKSNHSWHFALLVKLYWSRFFSWSDWVRYFFYDDILDCMLRRILFLFWNTKPSSEQIIIWLAWLVADGSLSIFFDWMSIESLRVWILLIRKFFICLVVK